MQKYEKLDYLLDLTLNCTSLWSWFYDKDFHLTKTSCPQAGTGNAAFLAHTGKIKLLEQEGLLPAVLLSETGLAWAVTCSQSGCEGHAYIALGPVFLTDQKDSMEKNQDFYTRLPVISLQEMEHCASMLHRTLTGETAPVYCRAREAENDRSASAVLLWARLQGYIKNGDLRYREIFSEVLTNRSFLLNLGAITMESSRKVALLTADLSCQAALEGGLSPKSIEAVRNQYIPQLKAAGSGYEIARLCDSLLYQLIRLVRRSKGNNTLSEPVLNCRMYIEEHASDRLTLEELSRQSGYSPDHLSKKFREEFGEPLKSYILRTKIQRAQLLLTTTNMPVSDIAAMLSFCSGSHFSKVFQRFSHETPANYRALHGRRV